VGPRPQAKRQFQFQREWHYEEVMNAAFESHHYQMENSVNGFATINRMAGVLTQVRAAPAARCRAGRGLAHL
jgi:hypothetical protein